jgi:DNA helicase-2/ATP-dependent DNA helicase PcrA
MHSNRDFLSALNENQRQAAEHGSGALLVVAGAGTGKTKTLAARVASLIERGADPTSILLLTFTRRAAVEMLRRAGQYVGDAAARAVWGGTFHSIAHRLLRMHHQAIGIPGNFVCMDPADAADLLNLIRTDLGLDRSKVRFPQKGTLWQIYSRAINAGQPLETVLADRFPWCQDHCESIKEVVRQYAACKADRGLLDFDDLLLYWQQALEAPGLGDILAQRFRHVLVDEYQDTNPVQASILRTLWSRMGSPDGGNDSDASLMVVGDDAQAIYGFRGATVENILRFPEEFSPATVIRLEQNYRSTKPILHIANGVMRGASRRHAKELWSERAHIEKPVIVTCGDELAQSTFIADRILEYRERGVPLMEQAVLFRTGYNSAALEIELGRRNIPYVKWGGLRFLEAAHVKDLLAFLRLAENPKDDLSWLRILQLFDGIGPGRARQAIQYLRDHEDALTSLGSWPAPVEARPAVCGLVEVLAEMSRPGLNLAGQIERIRLFYRPILESRYDNAEMRARDLDQLELLAENAPSREAFLVDLTLDPPVSTGDLAGPPHRDEEYVVLSTIHSAKGCEWRNVYLIHAADGVLPSDMANGAEELEEERRLLYVAVTRAKDRLVISFPLRYYHRKHPLGDRYSTAQLCRFLEPAMFELFDRQSHGRIDLTPAPAVSGRAIPNAVNARLQKLLG